MNKGYKGNSQKSKLKLLINKWTYTQPLLWKEMQNNIKIGYYSICGKMYKER